MTLARTVRVQRCLLALAAAAAGAAIGAPAAAAQGTPAPSWRLESRAAPTNLPLAHGGTPGEGVIVVDLSNLGDAPVNGEAQTVTATDRLPAGIEVSKLIVTSRGTPRSAANIEGKGGFKCTEPHPREISCTFERQLPAYEQLELFIRVKVTTETPSEAVNEVSVSGGEAAPASLQGPLRINGQATAFGVEQYELATEREDGTPDLQAGSHPYQMTTTFNLNQVLGTDYNLTTGEPEKLPSAPALQRNLSFTLPPGLIGNPNVNKQCPSIDFVAEGEEDVDACAPDTVIGVATVTVNDPILLDYTVVTVPVFNLVPPKGEPAQLGFEADHVPVVLNTHVRSGGDYGVTVEVKNAPQAVQLLTSRVTVWGVPGEESHSASRGWACLGYKAGGSCEKDPAIEANPEPFLTLPAQCNTALKTSASGESWPQSGGAVAKFGEGDPNTTYRFAKPFEGCGVLDFDPTLEVQPSTAQANTPAGMTFTETVPQKSTEEAEGDAEATARETTVTLPPGVLLSPSAANGLEACSEEERAGSGGVGYTGMAELEKEGEPGVSSQTFTGTLPDPLQPGSNFCPDGSKVGTVRVYSPDLPRRLLANGEMSRPELVGGLYLATQNTNPFGSLFAMYLVAEEPESGVLVKLAGEVKVNSETGQVTTSFVNTPDVPFEDLKLELFEGGRASVSTPSTCGTYETNATFTPWAQEAGTEKRTAKSDPTFAITSGPGGAPCASPLPFSPSVSAGSSSNQAGAYTNFELTLNHADTDQAPTSLTVTTPPGLAAMLSNVTPCPEPQASEGTCGPESLIGTATATVGLGSEPFTQNGGKVYITGAYQGAPYGLSVVIPTKAGPFDFGSDVTRSTININPNTAAVTIASALPTMVETAAYKPGIPVQVKQIHVLINRPSFEFNPTNCQAKTISGELAGAQGATAAVSSPFQVTGCAGLPFEPKLTIRAGHSFGKNSGVTFAVKVTSTHGQDNIGKTKLVIPEQLPSRLTTIQKACLNAVFLSTPVPGTACDEGSMIGEGIAYTPVLKSPLKGPAYLISHGGAAFPDVEFVLQGERILLVLDGQTNIQNGITTSTFNTVPDAPVSSFEAILPEGPHSALGAYLPGKSNLCGSDLKVPTTITAQNGAVIEQSTPVVVEGCSAAKAAPTAAQQLAKALALCRKDDRRRSKRQACERAARKRYAARIAKRGRRRASRARAGSAAARRRRS